MLNLSRLFSDSFHSCNRIEWWWYCNLTSWKLRTNEFRGRYIDPIRLGTVIIINNRSCNICDLGVRTTSEKTQVIAERIQSSSRYTNPRYFRITFTKYNNIFSGADLSLILWSIYDTTLEKTCTSKVKPPLNIFVQTLFLYITRKVLY